MVIYAAGVVFSIAMAIDAVRRGHTVPWLWIILFFGPIGATAYLVIQFPIREVFGHRIVGWKTGRRELERAGFDARRLDRADAWTHYATQLRERRRYKEAVEAAEKALSKHPEELDASYELALSLLATDRPTDALKPLRDVVDAQFNFHSGEAAYALAEALIKTGDSAGALPILEELAEISSRPQFLFGLASVQAERGDRAAARHTLERIVEEAHGVPKFAERETKRWVRRARKALARV